MPYRPPIDIDHVFVDVSKKIALWWDCGLPRVFYSSALTHPLEVVVDRVT